MKTKVQIFKEHISGTSFKSRTFRIETGLASDQLSPLDLTNARIKMDFKKDSNSRSAFTFDTDDNTITITDALNGEFRMNSRVISVCEDSYTADVLVKLSDNSVKRLFIAVQPVIKSTTTM